MTLNRNANHNIAFNVNLHTKASKPMVGERVLCFFGPNPYGIGFDVAEWDGEKWVMSTDDDNNPRHVEADAVKAWACLPDHWKTPDME